MERAIGKLKLNGFIINSHTNDEYLDDPKYFPVLEAAEALDACIYIHPRAPSAGFDVPLRHYGLDGALWGYGLEVGTHALRMILGGVFDRFPRLQDLPRPHGRGDPFLEMAHRLHEPAAPGGGAGAQARNWASPAST